MASIHQNLASGKWQELSLTEQFANIGSEVNRVIHWDKKGDKKNQEKAVWRVLELIDLTISARKEQACVLELVRLREILCDLFIGNRIYGVSPKSLQNYFLFFAFKENYERTKINT